MQARTNTADQSLATTRAVEALADLHAVLKDQAIIAHQPRRIARNGAKGRAGSLTPPLFAY